MKSFFSIKYMMDFYNLLQGDQEALFWTLEPYEILAHATDNHLICEYQMEFCGFAYWFDEYLVYLGNLDEIDFEYGGYWNVPVEYRAIERGDQMMLELIKEKTSENRENS